MTVEQQREFAGLRRKQRESQETADEYMGNIRNVVNDSSDGLLRQSIELMRARLSRSSALLATLNEKVKKRKEMNLRLAARLVGALSELERVRFHKKTLAEGKRGGVPK